MRKQPVTKPVDTGRHAAIAAVFGALLASSCCVAPLVLVALGLSGAWIGSLSVLEPYKGYIAIATLTFIGAGFWHVYFKKEVTCNEPSYCVEPKSKRLTRAALWVATAIVLSALTIDWWAPMFY